MVLGKNFPPEIRKAFIARSLVPWAVIRLHFDDLQKPKILAVADVDQGRVYYLFINSRPAPIPGVQKTQVRLVALPDHPFLDHDSYLDCSRLYYEDLVDVERQIMKDPRLVCGVIATHYRTQVLNAIQASRLMTDAQKKLILAVLGHQ